MDSLDNPLRVEGQALAADDRDRLTPDFQVKTVSTQLPPFNGKDGPEIWVIKVETILQGRNYSMDRWSNAYARRHTYERRSREPVVLHSKSKKQDT
ncbi:hypothetical protein MJO28_005316 [Puccinia striiformis f. sp. tritici]|uniref:Uncharacterized protein n=1 Tax=Puccinia striiformis f. sp. tritici TaxID=168172 RepID=A0ACC0EJY9_9BASI|nr:hypothetical protein MJO28_005316 [Puccinia striiformis f. sp. tritici]